MTFWNLNSLMSKMLEMAEQNWYHLHTRIFDTNLSLWFGLRRWQSTSLILKNYFSVYIFLNKTATRQWKRWAHRSHFGFRNELFDWLSQLYFWNKERNCTIQIFFIFLINMNIFFYWFKNIIGWVVLKCQNINVSTVVNVQLPR